MDKTEQEAILMIARKMFIDAKLPSAIIERAALSGAYDKGTWITDYIERATLKFLKTRTEQHFLDQNV